MIKKEIRIPESINDIKLYQWQKFTSIVDEDVEEEFVNRKALEIFYDIDGKHYNGLKISDITKIIGELNNALNQKITLIRRFELDGIEYGFIPDFDDITFGEFVDMDKYNNTKDYHKLMSILYRPIASSYKDTYKVREYEGSNEKLREMPLGVALSAANFFFTIGLQLTINILKSLTPKDQEQKVKQDLAINGLGILLSTPYRMETFSNSDLSQILKQIRL